MPDLNVIDASAELRLLRFLEDYTPPFDVMGTYRLIDDGFRPEATVTLRAGDQEMHEADLGVGPVDALANVLKKSLGQLFPEIPSVRLLDFKVRLIEGHVGTASQIEVGIVFSDGKSLWKVYAVDDNVNLASFRALLDGYEYAIYLEGKKAKDQSPKPKGKIQPKAQSPSPSAKASGDKKAKGTARSKPKAQKPKPKGAVKSKPKVQSPSPSAKASGDKKSKGGAQGAGKTKAGSKAKTAAKAKAGPKKK